MALEKSDLKSVNLGKRTEAFAKLKPISNSRVAASLDFTAADDVRGGSAASMLIDGTVKSLVTQEKIGGRLLDSIKLTDTSVLVLYAKTVSSNLLAGVEVDGIIDVGTDTNSLFAKFLTISNFDIVYSDEIDLGTSVVIGSSEDRFVLIKEPNDNKLILLQEGGQIAASQAAIDGEKTKGELPLLLTIEGESIQTSPIISQIQSIQSIITHPVIVDI